MDNMLLTLHTSTLAWVVIRIVAENFPVVSSFRKSKNIVNGKSGILIHEAPEPPLICFQRSFEGHGNMIETRLGTYSKVSS